MTKGPNLKPYSFYPNVLSLNSMSYYVPLQREFHSLNKNDNEMNLLPGVLLRVLRLTKNVQTKSME